MTARKDALLNTLTTLAFAAIALVIPVTCVVGVLSFDDEVAAQVAANNASKPPVVMVTLE